MARMRIPRGRGVLAVLMAVSAAACTWLWTRSAASAPLAPQAVLRVDTSRPGSEFVPGAVGLSTEARELSSGRLSASHSSLVRLMRLLGPAVLRVGGNSVDFSWWTSTGEPPPSWAMSTVTPTDLFALRGLLAATGWRVLLGVDFGHFEPARAADEARYARVILGSNLLGIEIGNEPDAYGGKEDNLRPPTYSVSEYAREAEAYRQALGMATPGMALFGPSLSAELPWLLRMGSTTSMFSQITQHYYPIETCSAALSPQSTAVELLSPAVRQQEDEILRTLVTAGSLAGRTTRIGETNSVACGGTADASPGFAGALWSLDWILRAESSGIAGLNFHSTLERCGAYLESSTCTPTDQATADVGDIVAQPEYYGLLAARQLEGGRFVPTNVLSTGPLPNLTTWATIAPSGTIKIAMDNLATAGLVQPVLLSIAGYVATKETLVGPSVSASNGSVFGAAQVTGKGLWRPKLADLLDIRGTHAIRVFVRPASAIILTLRRVHPARSSH